MPVKITETFLAKDRNQWRKWLLKYADKKKEVWLVIYKKHSGKLSISYNDAVLEALCFGWIDGILKRMDDERFAQRFSPRRKNSHWTKTNILRYKQLMKEGLITSQGKAAFDNRLKTS